MKKLLFVVSILIMTASKCAGGDDHPDVMAPTPDAGATGDSPGDAGESADAASL